MPIYIFLNFQGILYYNSYLPHHINRQLSADSKIKKYKIKISFVRPEGSKARANKTKIYCLIILKETIKLNRRKFFVMLFMIFQYGFEQVLIQQILIGFEAILEKINIFL